MYAHGFRFYFTPLTGVLFIFQSPYWYAIGRKGILSLGGWTPQIHTGFHEAGTTWDKYREDRTFRLRDCHLLWFNFPIDSTRYDLCNSLATQHCGLVSPTTPSSQRMLAYMNSVWALSISLAATEEVEVSFLSWGYLDVSVHPVRPLALCIQTRVTCLQQARFPYSEISGSKLA